MFLRSNFGGGRLPKLSILDLASLSLIPPFTALNCFTSPSTCFSLRGRLLPTLLALSWMLPFTLAVLDALPGENVADLLGVDALLNWAVLPTLIDTALFGSGCAVLALMLRFFSLSRILKAALSVTALRGVAEAPFAKPDGLRAGFGVILGVLAGCFGTESNFRGVGRSVASSAAGRCILLAAELGTF